MKKRALSALLTLCMVLGLLPAAALAASNIKISTLAELKTFRDEVNSGSVDHSRDLIELTADIDLGGSGDPWTPIGTESSPFKGIFDGCGHRITGLYINDSTADYQGLFGNVEGGTVRDLGVDGTVTGKDEVGGIVGEINFSSTVEGCYHTGAVKGNRDVGGVVGCVANQSIVENCYNTGTVTGQDTMGGVAGGHYSKTVRNCYNTGPVNNGTAVGGVAGYNWGTGAGCYYLVGMAAGDAIGAESKATEEFKNPSTFVDWDFSGVWKMSTALGRPILIQAPEPEPGLHHHPACGESCGHTPAHEAVTWKPLTQDSFTGGENGRPLADSGVRLSSGQYNLEEGHYYLTGDVSIDKKIYIRDMTVDLCLNGHTLTSEIVANSGTRNTIEVSYNAILNLCDCQGGGKITSNADYTLEIKESAASFANLYGGTVDSPTGICVETRGNLALDGATLKAGGEYVINAQTTSTVTIKSGKVEGSSTKCVQMTPKATFAMTDGTITNTGSGCGVSMSNLGGTVSGGTIHSDTGIGIDLASYFLTLSGNPTITGGEAGIRLSTNGAITVREGLGGTYSVLHANWRSNISESRPFTFTTAARADHSEHFTAATKMTGIAVRNSGEGSGQQLQLYMPHNWSSGWTTNATHHWHICHNSAEGNCTISDYAACGEAGAAYGAHQWAYETNPTQHRQKCTVCSYAESSWTPHTWDNAQDTECDICGYERTVPLYGTVTVTGTPKLGVALTAAVTGAPEGVTLQYAWTAAGSDTVLGTASTYTPTAADVGKTLTVTVSTGDERYTGSLTAVTAAVDKGDQAAPVGIFHITDVAYGQTTGVIAITGDAAKLEYRTKSTDGSDPAWTEAVGSNTLPAGTYEFRYKETATHNASPATEVQVRTLTPDAKRLTIAEGIEHGTVTKRRDRVNPGDTVTLAVRPDEGYELTAIAANYNDGEEKTITPTVKPDNAEQYTFPMPNADVTVTAVFTAVTPSEGGEAKGEVEVKGDTPAVTVDKDILKELAGTPAQGETVTVKLIVEKQEAPADKAELESVIQGKKDDVLYLDLSLVKQVNEGAPQFISDTGSRVLEIAVPYDFTGKKNVTVYRRHGGDPAQVLTESEAKTDGTYRLDETGGEVYIYASKFSTYAIGYTEETSVPIQPDDPIPHRSSRPSGGSSTSKKPAVTVEQFDDVKAGDWYYDSVKAVVEQGLMKGTGDAAFAPGLTTSRAMIATIIWRLAGEPEPKAELAYPDCVAGSWYAKAVAWGTERSVVKGYGSGDFGPDDPITREQLATMLWRYAGEPAASGTLNGFHDGDRAGDWAVAALRWAVEQGILTGRGDGVLDPACQATRAEAAVMLARYLENKR